MPETINKTGELAAAIYKNVTMGAEIIVTMMPKIKNDELKKDVTEQLASYEEYATKVKGLIEKAGEEPKEESMMSKFMAKMGVQMNTLTDSTTSHLAEMMIEGSTMNVNDLLRKIHEAEEHDGGSAEMDLARDVVSFEERNIEKLKDDYRTVAKMNLIDNFGYKEIADALEIPINTVKTKIRRAKAQLLKMMDYSDELL